MRLYHYTTWCGETVFKSQVVYPSNRYTIVSPIKLVFLTKDDEWESSIQAFSFEWHHEKCASHPEIYEELRIPCWKFEVLYYKVTPIKKIKSKHEPLWNRMIQDALIMGSNIGDWYVSKEPVRVIKSWNWKGEWHEKRSTTIHEKRR